MDSEIKSRLGKKDIFTIPNMLSFFRILLIPVMAVLYCYYEAHEAAVVVIAVFAAVYLIFGEKPVEGEKAVTIAVTNSAGETITYEVNTDAKYLRGAMEDADGLTFDGYESEFGLTLTTVNGEETDFTTAYWGTYVNGEMCNYGIDTQPVEDGDAFEIVYSLVADFGFEG